MPARRYRHDLVLFNTLFHSNWQNDNFKMLKKNMHLEISDLVVRRWFPGEASLRNACNTFQISFGTLEKVGRFCHPAWLSRHPPQIGLRLFSEGVIRVPLNEKLQRLRGALLPGDLVFLLNRYSGIPRGRSRGLRNRLLRFGRGGGFGHGDTPFAKKIIGND